MKRDQIKADQQYNHRKLGIVVALEDGKTRTMVHPINSTSRLPELVNPASLSPVPVADTTASPIAPTLQGRTNLPVVADASGQGQTGQVLPLTVTEEMHYHACQSEAFQNTHQPTDWLGYTLAIAGSIAALVFPYLLAVGG